MYTDYTVNKHNLPGIWTVNKSNYAKTILVIHLIGTCTLLAYSTFHTSDANIVLLTPHLPDRYEPVTAAYRLRFDMTKYGQLLKFDAVLLQTIQPKD